MTVLWHLAVRFMDWFCLKGPGYQFWSGIGLVIFMPLVFWWRHNCHVHLCPFWGHPDPDHGWPACRRHHSQADKLG